MAFHALSNRPEQSADGALPLSFAQGQRDESPLQPMIGKGMPAERGSPLEWRRVREQLRDADGLKFSKKPRAVRLACFLTLVTVCRHSLM